MKILSDEMPDELYEKCKTSSFTFKEAYEYMKCVTNGTPINEEQELRLPEEWCKDEDGISVLIHIDKNDYHRIVNGFANEDDSVILEDLFKNGVQLPKEHGKFIRPVIAKPKTGHLIRWYETIEREHCTIHDPHCKCSECDQEYDTYNSSLFNYCPNCGAKIEKEDIKNA